MAGVTTHLGAGVGEGWVRWVMVQEGLAVEKYLSIMYLITDHINSMRADNVSRGVLSMGTMDHCPMTHWDRQEEGPTLSFRGKGQVRGRSPGRTSKEGSSPWHRSAGGPTPPQPDQSQLRVPSLRHMEYKWIASQCQWEAVLFKIVTKKGNSDKWEKHKDIYCKNSNWIL